MNSFLGTIYYIMKWLVDRWRAKLLSNQTGIVSKRSIEIDIKRHYLSSRSSKPGKKLYYGFQKWCRVQSRRSLHYLAVLEARFFCSRSCLLSTSMYNFLSRRASINMYLIVSSPPSPLTLPVMLPPSCLTYVTLVQVIRNNCA